MENQNLAPYSLNLIYGSNCSGSLYKNSLIQNNLSNIYQIPYSEKSDKNYLPQSNFNDCSIKLGYNYEELKNLNFKEIYNDYYLKVFLETSYEIEFLDGKVVHNEYSNVYEVYNKKIKNLNALKVSSINQRSLKEIEKIQFLEQKNFPCLVKIYENFTTKNYTCILMELGDCDLDGLSNTFKENDNLNSPEYTCEIFLLIIKEILEALKFLKKKDIIFSDLKEKNIVLVKISETPEKDIYTLKFCDLESLISYNEYKEDGSILNTKSYFPHFFQNFLDENQFYHINVFSIKKIIENISSTLDLKNKMKEEIYKDFKTLFTSVSNVKLPIIEEFDKLYDEFLIKHGINLEEKKLSFSKTFSAKFRNSFNSTIESTKNRSTSKNKDSNYNNKFPIFSQLLNYETPNIVQSNENVSNQKAIFEKSFYELSKKLFVGYKERDEAFENAKKSESHVLKSLDYEIKSKNKKKFVPLLHVLWVYFETSHFDEMENCLQQINKKIERENLHSVEFTDDDDNKFVNEFFDRYYNLNALFLLFNKKKQDIQTAFDLFKKCLILRRNLFELKSTNIAQLYNNYGLAHSKNKNYEKALKKFQKSDDIRKEMNGQKNENWNNIAKLNIAKTLFKLGKKSEAIDLLNNLIISNLQSENDNSFYLVKYKYTLMKCFFLEKNFAKAAEILEEISIIMKNSEKHLQDIKLKVIKWKPKYNLH